MTKFCLVRHELTHLLLPHRFWLRNQTQLNISTDLCVEEIEKIWAPRQNVNSKSLCFPTVDSQGRGKNLDLFDRLDSGNLKKNKKLQLLPFGEKCQIKTVNDEEGGTHV